jgi:DNA-binding NarL/FixJ family response regulator
MDTGSLGVIVKSSPPQVLIEMLQRTLNGERCRPAPVRALSREDIPEDLRLQLSARQQKMLRAVVGGQSVSATARELNITPAKLVNEMRLVMSILRGRSF